MKYGERKTPLVILAGHEYGTGSSRDWAAKGTRLLGVKAVVAASYERIHRSNLVGMGVLPLQFLDGVTAQSLGLMARNISDWRVVGSHPTRPATEAEIQGTNQQQRYVPVKLRIDTPIESRLLQARRDFAVRVTPVAREIAPGWASLPR